AVPPRRTLAAPSPRDAPALPRAPPSPRDATAPPRAPPARTAAPPSTPALRRSRSAQPIPETGQDASLGLGARRVNAPQEGSPCPSRTAGCVLPRFESGASV